MAKFEEILNSHESVDLEFKSATGGVPRSMWETYSSFANTHGGTIYLGVKQKGHRFFVDGLSKETLLDYKQIIWDNLNNRTKVSINILKDQDVSEIITDDGMILEIRVPMADLSQRPVYINGNPDLVYKRNHEGDYRCTRQEINRMHAESIINEVPQDSRILTGFTLEDDIDIPSLLEYRQLFTILKPNHPWSTLDNLSFLSKLGAYRTNRQNNQKGLTLAGMLMFGKYESIVDNDCCPVYFPDYREYMTQNLNDRWSHRICPDGTWEANLFQFYRRVYNHMIQSLPSPFALKDGIRVEDSPVHVALREAFVNSIIHCDYTQNKSIVAIRSLTHFNFTNPGSLLVSRNQYFLGGESVCRNKALQKMFMLIGSAEKAGSGVDKIWSGWKSGNYTNPILDEHDDQVILEMPLINILSGEVKSQLITQFGRNVLSIDHNKLLVLAACATGEYVTNLKLQSMLELHPAEITALLKEMCSNKFLIATGIGRGTRYKLPQKIDRVEDSINMENNSTNMESNMESNSTNMESNVESNSTNVESNVESNSINMESNGGNRGNYNSRELRLERAIMEVCTEYTSLTEIAQRVHKSLKYLNNGVIVKMIEKGLIVRKYPKVPKHPDQQYKRNNIIDL